MKTISGRSFHLSFAAALTAVLLSLWPHNALAQAATLGEIMCNASVNMIPLFKLMTGIAYVAGAVLIGNGLVHLAIHHHRGPTERKLSTPIMHVVGGAALLAMPAFIRLVIQSIFGYEGAGGVTGCAAGLPIAGGGAGGTTLDQLMINLVTNIKDPMVFLLSVISCAVGIFLVIRGLMKASKYGLDPRANSVPNILGNIVIGAILFTVGQSLDVMLDTMFGSNNVSTFGVINWSNIQSQFSGSIVPFENAVYAALTFFQLIGMIAFIRGFLILKDAVEGQGQKTIPQGLTHILGGVFAINIYYFLVLMDNTFGTNLL